MITLIYEFLPKILIALFFVLIVAPMIAPRNAFAMKYPNRPTMGTQDRVQEHPTHSDTGGAQPEFPTQPDVDEHYPTTPTEPPPVVTPTEPPPVVTPTEPPVKK